MEDDTWLKINVDLVIRQQTNAKQESTCATWYIMVCVKRIVYQPNTTKAI